MSRYLIFFISFSTVILAKQLDEFVIYDDSHGKNVTTMKEIAVPISDEEDFAEDDQYTFTDDDALNKKKLFKPKTKQVATIKKAPVPKKEEIKTTFVEKKLPIKKKTKVVKNKPTKLASHIKPKNKKKIITKKTTHDKKLCCIAKKQKTIKEPQPIVVKKVVNGLNLRDAIIKALSRNKKVQALREKVIQAKRVVDQKRAGFLPSVILTAQTSKNDNIDEGEKYNREKFNKHETQISITQNIYAGGKTTNELKKAKASLKYAQSKYQTELEKEILNIIQAYLSVIYEKKSITVNRQNIKTLNKILKIATLKEKSGASTKGDLNYIKSNIENTRSELVIAESKYKNAISYYEYFVGDIDDGNYPIDENIKININPHANIEKLVLNNPQLLQIKAKIKKFRYEVESKKSRFQPTVDIILTQKHKKTSLEDDPAQNKKSATLSFNYPLYNGGKDKALVFESRSKLDEQIYKYEDLKKSLTFNAIQLLNNLDSIKQSLKHIKKQSEANKKVVDSYWSGFKYGNQDIQALLQAQNAYKDSQIQILKNKKNYENKYFQLLSGVGALLRYFGIEYLVDIRGFNQHSKLHMFGSDIDD